MTEEILELIDRLEENRSLSAEEYERLLARRCEQSAAELARRADAARQRVYGNRIFTRGLIEISNICRNDCLYCGIRRSNRNAKRYRLTPQQIQRCADQGYRLGFRTFVLQGGEDPYYSDEVLCGIVSGIKREFPDCAVTLSLGERSRESYRVLHDAGADRYLLRHETADPVLYRMLHPEEMSFENRMRCLRDLKSIGYHTGCGFMVGPPGQTLTALAKDLKFVETFRPEMCGIGPFIPQHDTPFGKEKPGTPELTCYLLSILRLIDPGLLLPSTTALGTIDPSGREKGILAGANVLMPNLSPPAARENYTLYDGKLSGGIEAAESRELLAARMRGIGFELVIDRGDPIRE